MRTSAIVVFALLSLLSLPGVSHACSCIESTLEERMETYDAVFVGKVVRLEILDTTEGVDLVLATLAPVEVVKGDLAHEVEILASNGCCYCAPWFDIAETYLVFARVEGAELITSSCVGGLVREHVDELRALGLEELVRELAPHAADRPPPSPADI
jgi:hypothetical protein